jgi:hypothetical protein
MPLFLTGGIPVKAVYFSPRFRLYPPACKIYGLEAEPETKSAVSRAANRGQKPIVDQFLSPKNYKGSISTLCPFDHKKVL